MKGITSYQLEVMLSLRDIEAKTGCLADLDQVLSGLSWQPSKESAQFVFRALIAKEIIEKQPRQLRRGRTRVCFKLTEKGLCVLDPRRSTPSIPGASCVLEEDFDALKSLESIVPGASEEGEF